MPERWKSTARNSGFAIMLCLLAVQAAQGQTRHAIPGDTLSKVKLPKEAVQQIIREIEASAYDAPNSWERELRIEKLRLLST